jgi:hypothetical protein
MRSVLLVRESMVQSHDSREGCARAEDSSMGHSRERRACTAQDEDNAHRRIKESLT